MTSLKTIAYLCLLFVIFSCKKKDETQNSTDGTNATSFAVAPQFSWQITPSKDANGEPVCTVGLVFDNKIFAAHNELIQGNLDKTDPKAYADLQIPAHALSACSGYYAGGTTMFYVLPNNENEVTLIKAYLGEEGGEPVVDKKIAVKVSDFKSQK